VFGQLKVQQVSEVSVEESERRKVLELSILLKRSVGRWEKVLGEMVEGRIAVK